MKKLWNLITGSLLILLLAFVVIMYVPKLVGLNPMIVLSGSMEPNYSVGSLVLVESVNPETVNVNDVITFYVNEKTLVTHRVVDKDEVKKYFITKGDANSIEDGSPVKYESVIGSPKFCIPKLGAWVDKFNCTSGKILYITAIIVVLILMFLGDWIEDEEKEKGTKKNAEGC